MRAACAALLVALGACGSTPAPAPRAPAARPPSEADLAAFIPAPAESVLSVDMIALRASPWAEPVLKWAATRNGAGETTDQAARQARGFDEVADVDRVVFGRVVTPGTGGATVELLRGRFARPRVEAAFGRHHGEARATTFGRLAGWADTQQAVAFVSDQTVVFGATWAVREVGRTAAGEGASARDERWLAEGRAAVEDEFGRRAHPPAIEVALRPTDEMRTTLAQMLGGDVHLDLVAGRLDLAKDARVYLLGVNPSRDEARSLGERLIDGLAVLKDRGSVRALGLRPVLERAEVAVRGARLVMALGVSEQERVVVSEKLAAAADLLAKQAREQSASAPPDAPAP